MFFVFFLWVVVGGWGGSLTLKLTAERVQSGDSFPVRSAMVDVE